MIRQIENALQSGRKNVYVRFSFSPLTLTSLVTFKIAVKKFEKYIMPKKAKMPHRFKNNNIKIILIAESPTLVRKVNFCWSRPFKMPSQMASKYINGTMGDNARNKKPTSLLL